MREIAESVIFLFRVVGLVVVESCLHCNDMVSLTRALLVREGRRTYPEDQGGIFRGTPLLWVERRKEERKVSKGFIQWGRAREPIRSDPSIILRPFPRLSDGEPRVS